MQFINTSYEKFVKRVKGKSIIQFGASSAWHYYFKTFPDIMWDVVNNTVFVVDNNIEKQGKKFEIGNKILEIKSVDSIEKTDNYIILITVSLAYQEKICEQLSKLNLPQNIECYSLPLMIYGSQKANDSCVDSFLKHHEKQRIVPKIHCCWFSGEAKPDLYKKCIESWYKYCPDFEIIEWTADNYDITKNQYMREAFEHKKWAFVSDYARLDIVYQHGGIYMDMDVELVASIKQLLQADSFFCRQEDGLLELGSGFGAKAGDALLESMLSTYKERKLILSNGEMDMTPQPEWLSDTFDIIGLGKCYDSQVMGERLILSNNYIACYTGENSTKNAKLGIHWHNGGWLDEHDRKLIKASFEARTKVTEQYFNQYR